MKRTRSIEDIIAINAHQVDAKFDRTRDARTSAIEGLLGDLGCEVEAKPSGADEDQTGVEEIFARAEMLLTGTARKEVRS